MADSRWYCNLLLDENDWINHSDWVSAHAISAGRAARR